MRVKTKKQPSPCGCRELGNFKMENDMKLRQKRLYDKNTNHATSKHRYRQKAEQPIKPLTEFERKLNQNIAIYAKQNLLTQVSFCCEQCQTHNHRSAPRNREHLQCARCGKWNDWKPVEISADFGGGS